jgi:hypothetical protein
MSSSPRTTSLKNATSRTASFQPLGISTCTYPREQFAKKLRTIPSFPAPNSASMWTAGMAILCPTVVSILSTFQTCSWRAATSASPIRPSAPSASCARAA